MKVRLEEFLTPSVLRLTTSAAASGIRFLSCARAIRWGKDLVNRQFRSDHRRTMSSHQRLL